MHKQSLLAIIIIALIGILVYFNSLDNSFVWDDKDLIVENPLIKNWTHLGDIFKKDLFYVAPEKSFYYRPIQSLSYVLDYSIYRLKPKGYHIANISIHILNAVLIYFLILAFTKNKIVSFCASAVFVVHPVYTSAVTYISGRGELLVTLFLLASFLLFIRCKNFNNPWQIFLYLLSLICYVCSLLSKESALLIPFLFLIYLLVFEYQNKKQILLMKISPIFLISIIYIGLRFYILKFKATVLPVTSLTLWQRFLLWFKTLALYAKLLFAPFHLHMERSIVVPKNMFQPQVMIGILFLIGAPGSLIINEGTAKFRNEFLCYVIFNSFRYLTSSIV